MISDIKTHERYMRRCIALAQQAKGKTYPNPMVGSVLVVGDQIVGEGFHHQAGTPHAEVHAIGAVANRELLKQSTLYVCLEPCAHFGRTPPCAKLIIESQIPRVVVGCVDSFSAVAGKGIEMLRNAGVDVLVGVLENECRELNKRFFTFHEKKRPYVILKWAESADGFIGRPLAAGEKPIWLTGEQCRRLVHKQRSEEQSIMVGAGTVITDNPQLNVRAYAGCNPLRIVVDPHLHIPPTALLLTDGQPTVVLNSQRNCQEGAVQYVSVDFSHNSSQNLLAKLYELGLQSVIIEGGLFTLQHFIDDNLWDEAFVYRSPISLSYGTRAPKFSAPWAEKTMVGDVALFRAKNV